MDGYASASPTRQDPGSTPVVGRQRSFWTGLTFYLLTFTLYGYVWHYEVYDELRRQFDLGSFPTGVFALTFLPLVLLLDLALVAAGVQVPEAVGRHLAYLIPAAAILGFLGQFLFMRRIFSGLTEARDRLGLRPAVSFGEFLAWYVVGSVVAVGPASGYAKLHDSLNEVWERLEAGNVPRTGDGQPVGPPVEDRALVGSPARPDETTEGTLLDCPRCGTQVRVTREPPVQVRCPDCGNTAPYHG